LSVAGVKELLLSLISSSGTCGDRTPLSPKSRGFFDNRPGGTIVVVAHEGIRDGCRQLAARDREIYTMDLRGSNQPVCAFCDSKRLGLVMDFGEVGLAGAFLKPEQFATERTFPMRLHFCKDCYAVQVTDKVPADVMFETTSISPRRSALCATTLGNTPPR